MTSSSSFPLRRLLVATVFAALAVGCQTSERSRSPAASGNSPAVKYMDVDGARLPYVEQGTGETVVLVHGAVGDYRSWDPHRPMIAQSGFRAVSYTMRYFGTEPWSANSPPFSGQLHSSDLASFIRGLNAGPVHLVSWSYSGQVVLSVALDNPELVKSVFAYELADPTYVTDQAGLKTIQESSGVMFGPVVQSLKQGDESEATRKLIDGVAGRSGYFEQQPERIQAIQLDNAQTVAPLFRSPPPRQITCAQLASIRMPVAVVQGSSSTPAYKTISETAAKCMTAEQHVVVPRVGHMWPAEDPARFSSTLVQFLKSQ